LALCVAGGKAQTASEALPEGPLLANPPAAQWRVSVSYKHEESADGERSPEPRLREAFVVKTGSVWFQKLENASGEQLDVWSDSIRLLVTSPRWPEAVYYSGMPSSGEYPGPTAKSAFPEVEWVSAGNFQGIKAVGGSECMVFVDKRMLFSSDELDGIRMDLSLQGMPFKAEDYKSKVTAYIDVKTRLPVLYQGGRVTYRYQHYAPPGAMLSLPPAMETRKKVDAEKQKDSARRPARS
jgi:hypothetical protein